MTGVYGEAPTDLGPLDLSEHWHEFLHYLYMPVRIPERDPGVAVDSAARDSDLAITLPTRLRFLWKPVATALADAARTAPHLADPYVYVTARRGYAAPGNPLNRPGFHCDDFGGSDLNYIWTDAFPTRFLLADEPLTPSSDDAESMADFEDFARAAEQRAATSAANPFPWPVIEDRLNLRIVDGPVNELLRLTPHVIHSTPEVPEPGGMRSFFKVSVSTHRYDLLGNSHNHLLDYDWPLYDRQALRNQPGAYADRDYSGVVR